MTNDELLKELEKANTEIADLRKRINQVERSTAHVSLPTTMILDHSFIKRALAIYGHVFVAGLIISVPIYCIIFLISLLSSSF